MTTSLPLLCFNDVYRVSQKYVPQPGAPSSSSSGSSSGNNHISVSQFGQLLLSEREKWADRPHNASLDDDVGPSSTRNLDAQDRDKGKEKAEKEGLVLFAGDVFNPSVPILNALKIDCSCVGNHDFDFGRLDCIGGAGLLLIMQGFPHLTKLLESTTFPWLLSNIVDKNTGKQPEPLRKYWVTERCGVRIGVVGLVEQDWIATIPSWPDNFVYRPMKDVALELSKELRDPDGPYKVDIIIALTHCRVPNDIRLANELGAVADKPGVENEHGVDLLIGGHDHIGKGAAEWDGFAGEKDVAGTREDKGVRLIKSGTDFRDLSSALLTLSPPNAKAIRRRLITRLTGKHHYVLPSSPSSPSFDELLKTLLSSVSSTLSKPVCFTLTPFDARSEVVRTRETGLGNWVADVLRHAYAESLVEGGKDWVEKRASGEREVEEKSGRGGREKKGADAVIICGGTLRGISQYGPGKITLGDILEIMPFEDPVVCLELDGKGIWDTLEGALAKWPAQEGRFPIVSGLAVTWDHNAPPNQRVKSIHLVESLQEGQGEDDVEFDSPEALVDFVEQEDGTRVEVKQRKLELGKEVQNEEGGRLYQVITRQYMADGYDGFAALKGRNFIIDDENGQIMSSIIRSFLLGSSYIFRHKQLIDQHHQHLSIRTERVVSRARAQHQAGSATSSLASSPRSPRIGLHSPNPRARPDARSLPAIREGLVSGGAPNTAKQLDATEGDAFLNPDDSTSMFTPGFERSNPGLGGRRHVVQHDWASIRDALHVAKNEHLSGVDQFEGAAVRSHRANGHPSSEQDAAVRSSTATSAPRAIPIAQKDGSQANTPRPDKPQNAKEAGAFIAKAAEEELKALEGDLAIVCPLIDGRMKDVAEGK